MEAVGRFVGRLVGRSCILEGNRCRKYVHILKGGSMSPNEGTSRVGKDFSLKTKHDALLEMKFNEDLILKCGL